MSRAVAVRQALSREVVSLYRDICRKVPSVLTMYQVEGYSVSDARHMILLNHFRTQSGVTDPRMIERLLAKAKMEMEEVMQQWKQKGHVQFMLSPLVNNSGDDIFLNREKFMVA